MPYVIAPPVSPETVLEIAARRWAGITEARPELAPAVDLQRRLLSLVLALATEIGKGRLPRLSLPPRYLAAKLGRGIPALTGEPVPLPALQRPLLDLCTALAEGGAGDAARHIRAAIESGNIDARSLATASLRRDQQAIRAGAVQRGLAPDLVWLVAELAVSPFVHALEPMIFPHAADDAALAPALAAWEHGYCPLCGSWAALAEVVEGVKLLRCSFCASTWGLTQYACAHCGRRGETLVTAAPDEARKDRRIEVCSACSSYLKTVDVPDLSPFPLVAITDLDTMDLDVAAMKHGYTRPAARDFSAGAATSSRVKA
jgi:FdhE protein